MAKKRKPKRAATPSGSLQLPGFQGSIVPSPIDALAVASGVAGARQIIFPKTKADVAAAVAASQGQQTIIRSGTQPAEAGDALAAGSNVIHLAALNNVSLKNGILNVEAGADTEAVAGQLVEKDLALPLLDNPQKNIVSSVLGNEPSCLVRTLGPLSEYVTKLTGVTAVGHPMTRSGTSAVERVRADNSVVTGLSFKPVKAKALWMFRKVFPYPGKDLFAALIKALFANTTIPKQSDIVVDATSGRYDLPIVRITAAGSSAKTNAMVLAQVNAAITVLPAETVQGIVTKPYFGSEVIKAVVDAGTSVPLDPEVSTQSIQRVLELHEDAIGFLDSVTEDVDRGLAFRDEGTGKRDDDFRLFARLQLDRDGRLSLSGYMYTPKPATTAPVTHLASVNVMGLVDSPLHQGLLFGGLFTPRIPGFKGSIYIPTDLTYRLRANQYATSSYAKADMTPFMVAYPRDVADIQAALVFAKTKQKHVVARSGGHQYSGMSSGGNATIVLSMDAFGQFSRVADNVYDVGPAVPLTTLAANFRDLGITIPHGECPLVCIGGHAQTGGFGHLLRGYGLALDHVISFTIVLADGTVRTVRRPPGAPTTDDDGLFWGVLGGNAGSFGIVTNYRIECIKDADHPNSYGYARMQKYENDRYKSLLKIVQNWTTRLTDGTLSDDLDFLITVESEADTLVPPVPTLLVELVHSNSGGPTQSVNGEQAFQPIIQAAEQNAGIWVVQRARGTKPLSYLSNLFVRRPPFTHNGREFRFPYRKRVNTTSSALTDEFLDGFADLVDKVVMHTDGVYLVFQMMIGGAQLRNSSRRVGTSIPRRDLVFGFVFDLFYSNGNEGRAEQLQDEMQALIDAHFSGGQEQKLFWGSFGDPDMTKNTVRNCYYDDATAYARLQQLKKKVDPGDLFHSLMTVKLP